MKTASSIDDVKRHAIHVRVPAPLAASLEAMRHAESMRTGRRVSLRALIEKILSAAVAAGDQR